MSPGRQCIRRGAGLGGRHGIHPNAFHLSTLSNMKPAWTVTVRDLLSPASSRGLSPEHWLGPAQRQQAEYISGESHIPRGTIYSRVPRAQHRLGGNRGECRGGRQHRSWAKLRNGRRGEWGPAGAGEGSGELR